MYRWLVRQGQGGRDLGSGLKWEEGGDVVGLSPSLGVWASSGEVSVRSLVSREAVLL